jgi:hypothetical protein
MPHKFSVNASNLVLMPKKTSGKPLQFYFFLNHVLRKTGRTPGEPMKKTSSIFHLIIILRLLYKVTCNMGEKKLNNKI